MEPGSVRLRTCAAAAAPGRRARRSMPPELPGNARGPAQASGGVAGHRPAAPGGISAARLAPAGARNEPSFNACRESRGELALCYSQLMSQADHANCGGRARRVGANQKTRQVAQTRR